MAVNYTFNDLKSPQWYHTLNKNTIGLHYNIGGQGHTFIPEEYISKGLRDGDIQRFNTGFLQDGSLESIFSQGALVDLEGAAPNWALNSLKKSGFGSKGVLIDNNTLKSTGVMADNGLFTNQKKYKIDEKSRTKGELLGLTQLDGQYVYLKQPQGSRAGLTYADSTGTTRAEYTKVRGGFLGNLVVDVAESFAEVPLLPEVIGTITGSPALYASLKGLQTAGSGGDLKDVFESGVKAYVSAGGLQGTPNLPTEAVTALETMTAVAGEEDPLQAFIKQYGGDALVDVLEGSDFANYAKSSITDVFGADTVSFLEDNLDYVKAGKDILIEGKDPSEVLVDRFGGQIVSGLGAESPTERALAFAGLKTGVAKDQGASDREALFAGAKEYYDRGGELPDAGQIASVAGLENVDFDINKFLSDLDLDFPTLKGQGYDLSSLVGLGINLPNLSGIETPELLANFQIPELANLGFNVPSLDLSGFKPTDLGYDVGTWGQLQDLGVDIGSLDLGDYNLDKLADLNLDLQLPGLEAALKKAGMAPSEYASLDPDKELFEGDSEFLAEQDEEIPLSQIVLASV